MLFSLKGWGDDRHRLASDIAERRRLEELVRAEQAARARIAEEAEQRRRLAQREAALRAEERKAEQEARLEALRAAAAERARVEAEAQARLHLVERQEAHERELLQLEARAVGHQARRLAVFGFSLAGLSLALALGMYAFKLRPEADRLQAAYDRLLMAERLRGEETKQMLSRADRRRAKLVVENGDLKRQLDEARQALEAARKK